MGSIWGTDFDPSSFKPHWKPIPTAVKPVVRKRLPWWLRILINIGIYSLAELVTAGLPIGMLLGEAIQGAVTATVDATLDAIEGDDGSQIVLDVVLDLFPVATRSAKALTKSYTSRAYRTVSDIEIESRMSAQSTRDLFKPLADIGKTDVVLTAKNRAYREAEEMLSIKAKDVVFAETLEESGKRIKPVQKSIRTGRRYIQSANKVLGAVNSPQYLARAGAKKLTSRSVMERLFGKTNFYKRWESLRDEWNELVTRYKKPMRVGKNVITKDMVEFTNSSVILGVRFWPNGVGNLLWNAMVYFRPEVTNYKKPVLLWAKNRNLFLAWVKSESPMRFYIDNFSFGWTYGKIMRMAKEQKAGKLSLWPVLSTLASPLITSVTSTLRIAKTLQDYNSLLANWKEPNLLKQLELGAIDGVIGNSRWKGVKGAVSGVRSFVTNRDFRFAAHMGASRVEKYIKQTNKRWFDKKLKKK